MTYCTCGTREEHPASECVPSWFTDVDLFRADIGAILDALSLGDQARPYSMHAVVHREILPAIERLRGLSGRSAR